MVHQPNQPGVVPAVPAGMFETVSLMLLSITLASLPRPHQSSLCGFTDVPAPRGVCTGPPSQVPQGCLPAPALGAVSEPRATPSYGHGRCQLRTCRQGPAREAARISQDRTVGLTDTERMAYCHVANERQVSGQRPRPVAPGHARLSESASLLRSARRPLGRLCPHSRAPGVTCGTAHASL